jgi:hypothetical protein
MSPNNPAPENPIRHIVMFRYAADATEEQIQRIAGGFKELVATIEGITAFEYGTNNSPEGKNNGFNHVYLLTFADAAARDAYLPHPEHQNFGKMLRQMGILEEVFVVDYVPQS